MKAIYRYTVPGYIPAHAKVVHFGWQHIRNEYSVWAEVDVEKAKDRTAQMSDKYLDVIATGSSFEGTYLKTAIMPDDFHTFHLIEKEGP